MLVRNFLESNIYLSFILQDPQRSVSCNPLLSPSFIFFPFLLLIFLSPFLLGSCSLNSSFNQFSPLIFSFTFYSLPSFLFLFFQSTVKTVLAPYFLSFIFVHRCFLPLFSFLEKACWRAWTFNSGHQFTKEKPQLLSLYLHLSYILHKLQKPHIISTIDVLTPESANVKKQTLALVRYWFIFVRLALPMQS